MPHKCARSNKAARTAAQPSRVVKTPKKQAPQTKQTKKGTRYASLNKKLKTKPRAKKKENPAMTTYVLAPDDTFDTSNDHVVSRPAHEIQAGSKLNTKKKEEGAPSYQAPVHDTKLKMKHESKKQSREAAATTSTNNEDSKAARDKSHDKDAAGGQNKQKSAVKESLKAKPASSGGFKAIMASIGTPNVV